MATLRDIKRRIDAVDNIQQITRAMYMVAAATLRKAEERVRQARPYAAELAGMLGRLAAGGADQTHPLLQERVVQKRTYVVVTGDRGLCGSYNANMIRQVETTLRNEAHEYELVMVGRKGRDYFRRRGAPIVEEFVDLGEEISYETARDLSSYLSQRFLMHATDEVIIEYTQFKSALSQMVTALRLLPIAADTFEETEPLGQLDYFYEPSADRLFGALLPKYIQNQTYQALMESKASEHGARMTAMKNATDNADELIDTLTLDFNRARQAAITREIAEIVGGAEAINQG